MDLRNVTWPQVALFLGSIAAVLIAAKFLPGIPADLTALLAILINFLLGRDQGPPPPRAPSGSSGAFRLIAGAAAAMGILIGVDACMPQLSKNATAEIADHGRLLAKCREEGRIAKSVPVFDACMDGGAQDAGKDGGK